MESAFMWIKDSVCILNIREILYQGQIYQIYKKCKKQPIFQYFIMFLSLELQSLYCHFIFLVTLMMMRTCNAIIFLQRNRYVRKMEQPKW